MAEPTTPPQAASPAAATVIPTQVTTETLDVNGNSLPSNSNLASIFDKIESGVDRKDAVKEVMKKGRPAPKQDEAPAEKKEQKEIKVTSSHPEGKDVKEEVPASGLNDALTRGQNKKEEPVEEAPVREEAATAPEEIPEEELQVLPHDKPKTAKRISALLQKIAKVTDEVATTRREREERDTKLKELETKLAEVKTIDPKTEEEIAATKKELNMFRRRYDLDKDPEVKQKFDARIEQADAAIPDILKKNSAGDALLKLISDEGGWGKFAKSSRIVTLSDGSKVTSAELADQIVEALPFADRSAVNALTMEQIAVKREKDRFLEAEIKAADEFFKSKEAEASKGSEDYKKQVKDAEEAIKKWQQKVAVENAFMKEKEVPKDASPEQKKAIEEDNAHAKLLNETLSERLKVKDLDGMLNVVLEAVQFHQEKRERAKLTAELAKVKAELKAKAEEIDRIKSSGKTTPKSGSLVGGGSTPVSVKEKKPQSLEAALDALASARSSGDDE